MINSRIFTVLLCFILFADISYCQVNYSPKNAAGTPSGKSNRDEVSPQEKPAPAPQDVSIRALSNPTYYTNPNKAMLDEDVRYIQSPAAAAGPGFGIIHEKRVRFKLDSDINYDDNIYLTHTDKKYDIITRLSPGVYGYAGNDNYTLLGFYEADVLIYGINTSKSRVNQVLGGTAYLFKNGKLNLKLSDVLRPTTDPPTSEITAFVKRVHNDFIADINYNISPKTSIAFNYELGIEYFLSDDYKAFNYFQHTLSPVVYYHLTPKTSITAEYNLGVTHYTGSAGYNSVYHQGRIGVIGALTPKSTVGLKAGYQFRFYDSKDRKNAQGFVMQAVYDYLWSPKTSIQLIAASDINESVYADVGYFNNYSIYANLTHHILYNLDLNINGLYILSNYPHTSNTSDVMFKKRIDSLYGAGVEATYRFRTWLSAYAGYNFKSRISNIDSLEYIDNIIHSGVKLDF